MCEWDYWPLDGPGREKVGERWSKVDTALPGLSSADMWENEFLHRREEINKEA